MRLSVELSGTVSSMVEISFENFFSFWLFFVCRAHGICVCASRLRSVALIVTTHQCLSEHTQNTEELSIHLNDSLEILELHV